MAEIYRAEISIILKRISSLNSDLFAAKSRRERKFILEELEVAYCELSDAIGDFSAEIGA